MLYAVLCYIAASEVVFVAQISRHGARSPKQVFEFNKSVWPKDSLKSLTALGLKQHYELGSRLAHKYNLTLPEVSILSSNTSRTYASAWAQALGVLLDSNPFTHLNSTYTVSGTTQNSLKATLGLEVPLLPVYSEPKGKEFILHNYKSEMCAKISQIKQKIKNSQAFLSKEAEQKEFLKRISLKTGENLSSIRKACQYHGSLDSHLAHNFSIPLSTPDYDSLANLHAWTMHYFPFSDELVLKISCAHLFRDILKHLDYSLSGGRIKLRSYVGHDNTLIAVSKCLKSEITEQPPYSANFLFEVYRNYTLKVYYQNKELRLPYCHWPCLVSDIKRHFSNFKYQPRICSEAAI